MGKPFIEHNGMTYEFESGMQLRLLYNKAIQTKVLQSLQNAENDYTQQEILELQSFQEDISKGKIKEEDFLNNEELKIKMAKYLDIVTTIDLFEVNLEFCFKMLNIKYKMKKEQFDDLIGGLMEDYGDEAIGIINEICNQVFTKATVEKKTKKPLPSWMTTK